MDFLFDLFLAAVPLLSVSVGVLTSEFAGVMAVYADGMINFGGFLYYAVVHLTGSVLVGVFSSLMICVLLALAVAAFTKKFKANPFLTGLALNLGVSGTISLLSVRFFGTRGVLFSPGFMLSSLHHYGLVSVACFFIVAIIFVLAFTKVGLYLRITGSSPETLVARGINPESYKIASWGIAAFFSAVAGCIMVSDLSSFVPNISSGCGWTALAVVFLGKRKIKGVVFAVFVFVLSEYIANNMQNIPVFKSFPSALLLAFPYFAALLFIALDFSRKRMKFKKKV